MFTQPLETFIRKRIEIETGFAESAHNCGRGFQAMKHMQAAIRLVECFFDGVL